MKEVLDRLHSEIKEIAPTARLMAVSKTHPYEAIEYAYELGERLFGENRVQEVESKFPLKADRPSDMDLHLIGHLQSNKVKKAVSLVDSIDSVDSLKLLKMIDKRAKEIDTTINILLEFNTSGDENKSGFESYDEIKEALNASKTLSNIKVNGLMTIGPLGGSDNEVKDAFLLLVEIKKKLEIECDVELKELSMGMSGDYKIALENGSTMIRVGTMIFGARDYSKKK
jgi:pyridoxal phosphate enzyme (YggS family)